MSQTYKLFLTSRYGIIFDAIVIVIVVVIVFVAIITYGVSHKLICSFKNVRC